MDQIGLIQKNNVVRFGSKKKENEPVVLTPMEVANLPDEALKNAAAYDAYNSYKNDPTRGVTRAVGTAIPFADSFVTGAMTKGSGARKLAATGSRASDWGVFAGAIWLYNKALNKVYNAVPGAREFKQEHPTAAFAGEIGTGLLVGEGAVIGFNKGFEKITNKTTDTALHELIQKTRNGSKLADGIFKNVKKVTDHIPGSVKSIAGPVISFGLIGLIAKNIFDVHNANKKADRGFEELKDQRHQVTKAMLDDEMQKPKVFIINDDTEFENDYEQDDVQEKKKSEDIDD